jgi:hypothetical protein
MWGKFETAKKFPPIIEFWWVLIFGPLRAFKQKVPIKKH